jgi:hypothetical protein
VFISSSSCHSEKAHPKAGSPQRQQSSPVQHSWLDETAPVDSSERVKRQRRSSRGCPGQQLSLALASEARERPRRHQQNTKLRHLSHQARKGTSLSWPSMKTAGLQGHEGIVMRGIEKASTQNCFRQTHATREQHVVRVTTNEGLSRDSRVETTPWLSPNQLDRSQGESRISTA